MAYRNGNYVAFYVVEPFNASALGAHATKDFYYYDGRFYKTLEELIKELNFGEILDEFFTYPQIVQLISSCDDSSINSYLHIKKFDELLKKNVSNDKKILLIKNPELFFEDFNGLKKTSKVYTHFRF